MTDATHPEDEPLDIAPEGDAQDEGPSTPAIVAEAALAVARKARDLADAFGRACGRLRHMANAIERDALSLAGSAEEMEALADQPEGPYCD